MTIAAAALHAGKSEDAHANGRSFSASSLCTTRRRQHRKGDFSSTRPSATFYAANLSHSRQSISRQFSTTHATCCRLSTRGAPPRNRLVVPSTPSRTRQTLRAPRLLARNGMHYPVFLSPFCSSFPRVKPMSSSRILIMSVIGTNPILVGNVYPPRHLCGAWTPVDITPSCSTTSRQAGGAA